jgi:hypothetical protein
MSAYALPKPMSKMNTSQNMTISDNLDAAAAASPLGPSAWPDLMAFQLPADLDTRPRAVRPRTSDTLVIDLPPWVNARADTAGMAFATALVYALYGKYRGDGEDAVLVLEGMQGPQALRNPFFTTRGAATGQ